MHEPLDFLDFDSDFEEALYEEFVNLDAKLPVAREMACYNLAGVISSNLCECFDLSKISKRDVALYISANGRLVRIFAPNLYKVAKYVREYFAPAYAARSEAKTPLF